MTEDIVLLEKTKENEHIAILTLNRSDKSNALNSAMLHTIAEKLSAVDDDKTIWILIIRSAGKHSSYGGDLYDCVSRNDNGDFVKLREDEAKRHITEGREVAKKLFYLRVPIIGLIHGFCLGGGAELFSFCDILYGASGRLEEGGLMFGFPEVKIGCMPGWLGPELIMQRINPGKAKEILFTGRTIDCNEALSIGIVQALYPKDELLTNAIKLANEIIENAPLAVESTRRSINQAMFPHFDKMLESTGIETTKNLLSSDFLMGATKILKKQKEKPKFKRQ